MKLKNIFKKETKKVSKTNIEKLNKNQLEKVVGGTETTLNSTSSAHATEK